MNKNLLKWGMAATAAGIGFVLLDALVLEKYFFQVKTFLIGNIKTNKKLKLLLLTDLHFKNKLWAFHYKLAKTIIEQNPDLIIITGDLIDKTGKPTPAQQFLDLIPAFIPKVAVLGNHDYKGHIHIETFKKIYAQHNCTLLINESKAFIIDGERMMVTGLDDDIESNASLEDAVKGIGSEDRHILLAHSPVQQKKLLRQIEEINETRTSENRLHIQYIFSGHVHGGQIRFFGFAPVTPKASKGYLNGWYNEKPPYLYVSKGLGTTALPFRFGARSEVTVFKYGV